MLLKKFVEESSSYGWRSESVLPDREDGGEGGVVGGGGGGGGLVD